MADKIDNVVGDILNQLTTNTSELKKIKSKANERALSNLEEYLIEKASELIERAVEATNEIDATDPEAADALASLIRASSAAIDTLNKLYISKERNKSNKEIKLLDIKAKKELVSNPDNVKKVTFTREEILKHLMQPKEVDNIPITQDNKAIDV